MVGSSKILTVSYGTFSCTLEGFDDSFDTMKAIAEYFRDLAADDRYFGAEPPTPDAEMLARIAEREIARRVEAHEHQGRIVLRAEQETRAPIAALATAAAAAPGLHEAEDPRPESEEATAPQPDEVDQVTPDMKAPDAETAIFSDAGAQAEPEPEALPYAETVAQPEAVAEAAVEWSDEAEIPAAPHDLAAKLNLIRSVVGADAQYSEDEHAQDFVEPETMDEASLWPEDVAETDAPEVADAPEPEAMDEAQDTDDLPVPDVAEAWQWPADADDDETAEAALADDLAEEVVPDATEAEPEAEAADAASWSDEDEEGEDAADLVALDEDAPADDGMNRRDAAFEDTLAALLADAAADAPEAETARAAHVLKVKRADFEAAQAEGLFEEIAEKETGSDDDPAGNIFDEDDSPLSPEEEADLQRELAELDAELGEDADDAIAGEDRNDAAADLPQTDPAPDRARFDDVAQNTDLERIFGTANTHMADPESNRRRNTIQHLRAALAATRAEKEAGADLIRKPDADPYRGDLAAAVRPRRPETTPAVTRSARPEEPRPAPLKLVAEQRVDTARAPVRPRRVATPEPEVLEVVADGGFSEFAEELGATALPDLLEAAAAYLADVEGRAQFSRPMLMGKLKEVEDEGFSREEGLRSFGKLLREGKLQKLSGGRFAVTEETEFRAAARRRAS